MGGFEAGTTTFTWTARSELDTLADPVTGVTLDWAWDDASQPTSIEYGTGSPPEVADEERLVCFPQVADLNGVQFCAFWMYEARYGQYLFRISVDVINDVVAQPTFDEIVSAFERDIGEIVGR